MNEDEERKLDDLANALGHSAAAVQALGSDLRAASSDMADRIRTLERRLQFFERLVRLLVIGMVLGVVAIVGQVFLSVSNRATLRTTQKTANIVQDVVDPTGEFSRRSSQSTASLVGNLAIDQDCRNRRALAALPSPRLGEVCVNLPDNPPGAPNALIPQPAVPPPHATEPTPRGTTVPWTLALVSLMAMGGVAAAQRETRERDAHEGS